MNALIRLVARFAPIDDWIPGNGSKTIIGASILFAAWVGQQFGYVTPELFNDIATFIGGAFGVTLALKIPRAAAAKIAGLLLVAAISVGCATTLGPQSDPWVDVSFDPGVCLSIRDTILGDASFGFCTEEGASTDVLDGAEASEDAEDGGESAP